MLSAILPIKPEYVERIFSGEKKFEFRKSVCKQKIEKIIIYETSPVSKIVGEVSVLNVIADTPLAVWEKTKDFSGIDFVSYKKYFSNKAIAYAYVLLHPIKYEKAYTLSDFGLSSAPQNFVYVDCEPLR